MIWALLQHVGGQGANWLVVLVLASLLRPTDFGLIGMAGVWLAVLAAFAEAGFGAALVQRREIESRHLSTTFAINLATGAILTAAGVALSWPAAAFFRTPALQPVMAALSIGFAVRAVGLTHAALAQRDLRFRALALRDFSANLAGGAVGIAMALAGRGVWSLVAMSLTSAVVGTLLLWWVSPWRPRRHEISRDCAAELWPYSSRVLGFNLFKAVAQNVDRLVIGLLLGSRAVGVYSLAARLVLVPTTTVAGAVGQYLFPSVARLQDDLAAVRAQFQRVTLAVLAMLLPWLVAAVLLAPVVVVPVLGAEWADAVPVVQVLAVAALAQVVFSPVGQLMKALGRPGWLLAWSIGFTALTAAALAIGARWGVVGTAAGYAAAHVLALPVILWIGRRLAGFTLVELLRGWAPTLGAAALLSATLWGVLRLEPLAPPVTAALGVGLAGAVYLAALAWLAPAFVRATLARLRHAAAGGTE